jgi:hypothetical protein
MGTVIEDGIPELDHKSIIMNRVSTKKIEPESL